MLHLIQRDQVNYHRDYNGSANVENLYFDEYISLGEYLKYIFKMIKLNFLASESERKREKESERGLIHNYQ